MEAVSMAGRPFYRGCNPLESRAACRPCGPEREGEVGKEGGREGGREDERERRGWK